MEHSVKEPFLAPPDIECHSPIELPAWSEKYIGIPFLDHGRAWEGCDCYGLCALIWREQFNLKVPSYGETYATVLDGATVSDAIRMNGTESEEWQEIPAGDEKAGDAVLCSGFYNIEGGWKKADMHVGLVLKPGTMIHVERGIDASLADYRKDRRFNRRVVGFYRHQKLP